MKRSPHRYTPHAQRSDSSRACTRAESRRRLGLAFIIGVISSAATSITVTDATAQGRSSYLNFETPQVKPITVARIGGRDWLLCCNTPDNSLEIYDCETNGRIDRIAVGLEPVSVKWNAALSRAYTTNMVGDSVSVISLTVNAQGRLVPRLDRTEWVGDEPMDIEFSADGLQCFVTLHTAGAIAWLDAFTLKPFLPGTGKVTIVDSWSQATKSIKEPRRIQRIGNRLYVLANKGTRFGDPFNQQMMDLWSVDLTNFALSFHSGIGTAGLALAATSSGDLFAGVGEARFEIFGEQNVKNAPYGFVESWVQRIDNPSTATPTFTRRNLNRVPGSSAAVTKTEALAHASDLAIVEDAQGNVLKVYVAAFHSDKVGLLTNVLDNNPDNWGLKRIAIPVASGSTNSHSGPRGLAYKAANPSRPQDPGQRLYVMNRLDNSVAVIDAVNESWLTTFTLKHDPTPLYIREGRPFLYSADFSGNGFVSCASCHPDGRLDGQIWDLGGTVSVDPFIEFFVDGAAQDAVKLLIASGLYTADKGRLVTQSLQGLLNWEVDPTTINFVTNAPYHWRGDRPNFEAFNGAFASLLGGDKLEEQDMIKFRDMVNSIHYPPNPEQMLSRRYSGDIGDPSLENDGSGALAGMKLYHIADLNVCQQRSCVQCHSLPEGSNNRITEVFAGNQPDDHPLETAALRGLLQKERALVFSADVNEVGLANAGPGLDRVGLSSSINNFNAVFQAPGQLDTPAKATLVNQFCREFDWGVGPLVGLSITFDVNGLSSPALGSAMAGFITGANEANSGFVAQVFKTTTRRGFVYDPQTTLFVDVETGAQLTRANLLGLITGPNDRLVLVGTPLGSERRIAHPTGTPATLVGPAPASVTLEPMRPNTAYRDVPLFVDNWDPTASVDPFLWTALFTDNTPVPEPRFLRTTRLFQWGLVQDGPSFGLPRLRHDAPRRFRVSGDNIRPGAVLVLRIPTQQPPYANFNDSWPVVVPVYQTNERTANGQAIWESAVEFEPLMYYGMMLGGPAAPNVVAAWNSALPEPPAVGTFAPATWNLHHVTVVNADGSFGIGGWQALRIQ